MRLGSTAAMAIRAHPHGRFTMRFFLGEDRGSLPAECRRRGPTCPPVLQLPQARRTSRLNSCLPPTGLWSPKRDPLPASLINSELTIAAALSKGKRRLFETCIFEQTEAIRQQ